MQSGWVEIVFLAMLAAFIGLRLYHVLGRRTERTGTERAAPDKPADKPLVSAFRPSRPVVAATRVPAEGSAGLLDIPATASASVRSGLQAIADVDPHFRVGHFLDGASGAYRMVLEAFWSNDRGQIAELVSDEMLADFSAALVARKEAGERVDNRLIAIDSAEIVEAGLNGTMAEVTVRFDAEIVSATRDSAGRLIAGDPHASVETHDLWTFSRHTASSDPAWILIATDEDTDENTDETA